MAKKKKHGGARKGAGRPEAQDKAVQISFYTKESRVEAIGKEEIKIACIKVVEKKYKKIKR